MSRPTLVTVAVLGGLAAPAIADPEHEDPEPVPTKLSVRLDGATAVLRLSARLDLAGPRVHATSIDVPLHGVLIGATVRERGRAHPLDLVDADDANERVAVLEEGPAGTARGAAILLSDAELGRIEIIAAVPRRTVVILDLEYAAATCFLRDHRHVRIPEAWEPVLDAASRRYVVSAQAAAEDGGLDARCAPESWDDAAAVWLALPTTELAARPPGDDRIGVRAARFTTGPAELARVELALAATMSAVPADLATAFVVDASRSLTSQQVAGQRQVIRSYLHHAPGSRVQLIAFDRVARPLLPRWTPATSAAIPRALDRLAAANGSDLDRGLAAAAAALADVTGTRRVVVFTDELVPARVAALDPARLAAVFPAGTVVHVVALDDYGELARDDDGMFAPLAIATTGLAARAGDDGNDDDPGAAPAPRDDVIALVRPVTIDHLRVIAPGFGVRDTAAITGTACDAAPALREGDACTWWAKGPATAEAITLEGRVWNQLWRRVVPLGDPASRELARDAWAVLDDERDPTMMAAADLAARAVNRRWSLLATWGGTAGYDDVGAPTASFGSGCGCGGPSGELHGGFGYARPTVRWIPVRDQIERAITACRAGADATGAAEIALELDTTRDEIVDVTATVTGVAADRRAAIAACALAAVWDLELVVPDAPEHAHWALAFAPVSASSDPASSQRAPADRAPAPATP